jgi:F-type H+-transporting ATPase subunit b
MSSGALPQLNIADFEPQIIWLLIVFSIFYCIIKNRIAPYFSSETENRESYILNNHQDAKKLQKKAERLSDEYNEKMQAVHVKANNLILEEKQKLNRHLEVEKKRLNEEISTRFNENCALIDKQIEQIDKELSADIDILREQAKVKLLTNTIGVGGNSAKNYNDTIIGGLS